MIWTWLLIHIIILVPDGINRKEKIKLQQYAVSLDIIITWVTECDINLTSQCTVGIHGRYQMISFLKSESRFTGIHSKCWTPSFLKYETYGVNHVVYTGFRFHKEDMQRPQCFATYHKSSRLHIQSQMCERCESCESKLKRCVTFPDLETRDMHFRSI